MWTLLLPTVLIGEVTAHNFLDYPQPGFERAAQLYQLAARVEVRVVVANTAAYLRSNLISQLEHIERQAKVQWSTQQLTLLNETSHAFERALDNQMRISRTPKKYIKFKF